MTIPECFSDQESVQDWTSLLIFIPNVGSIDFPGRAPHLLDESNSSNQY